MDLIFFFDEELSQSMWVYSILHRFLPVHILSRWPHHLLLLKLVFPQPTILFPPSHSVTERILGSMSGPPDCLSTFLLCVFLPTISVESLTHHLPPKERILLYFSFDVSDNHNSQNIVLLQLQSTHHKLGVVWLNLCPSILWKGYGQTLGSRL